MSPEERQLLVSLFDRVKTAASGQRDAEAEDLINQSVREQPNAPYYLAQAVIVMEKGMEGAATRIKELESRVQELEAHAAQQSNAQSGTSSGFLGGLGSIFGGGQSTSRPAQPTPYAPQRSYDDQPQSGPWGQRAGGMGAPPPQSGGWGAPPQQGGGWGGQNFGSQPSAGGGFLRGALGTAAGVAGGVMLAESLQGLFSPHMGGTGLFGGGQSQAAAAPQEETVINNYYGDDANDRTVADDGSNSDGFQQADFGNDDTSADWGSDDDSYNV